MPSENQKEQTLKDSLARSYRLILQKTETFEEKINFQFKPWQVLLGTFLSLILLVLLIGSLIIFTPLKRLIPGYGDLAQFTEITKLNEDLDELERQLAIQKNYSSRFMKMLRDSVENEEMVRQKQQGIDPKEHTLSVEKVKEDEELRNEIEAVRQKEQRELLAKSNSYSKMVPLDKISFVPPVKGSVSGAFMPEKKHLGVDLIAPKSTPVKASLDGYVMFADWTIESGQTIGIQHQNNIITFYKHNSSLLKKQGDIVKAGEAIAIIGNTGTHTDGPHVHFELWHDGKALDPAQYIQF